MLRTKNRFWASKAVLYYPFLCKLALLFICWSKKSIFRPQRESDILTLLGAKQPYQVASFHLSLSGSKAYWFWKNRFSPIFFDFKVCSKGQKIGRSASDDLVANDEKITKTWFYHLQTLDSCRGSSQQSANIFWRSRGCLKLLKVDLKQNPTKWRTHQ